MKKFYSILLGVFGCVSLLCAQSVNERYVRYIEQYAAMAQEQQREHGVPAAITLAQGLLESAAGQSELARNANNHFGIKCAGDWNGATYHYDDDRKDECFRKYRKVEESFRDHSLFLKRKRYASLFELSVLDYKGWAHGLKRCGYATDPNYAPKLINLIEKYDLAKYSDLKGKKNTEHRTQNAERRTQDTERRTQNAEHRTSEVRHPEQTAPRTSQTSPLIPQLGSVDLQTTHEVKRCNGKKYVVARQGDTFYSIAQEFNISETTIRKYNDIINPRYQLQPGDKVYLQRKAKRAEKKYAIYYVRRGENIWQIAQDKGMLLKSIYELNGIEEGQNVTINQKLRLR